MWELKEAGSKGNYGATIGLIGFGAIGREVVARLRTSAGCFGG